MDCDSDSSGDDHLLTPSQIDLSSEFFNTKTNAIQCNSAKAKEQNIKPSKTQKNRNDSKENTDDELPTSDGDGHYSKYKTFNKILDDAKCAFQQLNNKNSTNSEPLDISTLLALGEQQQLQEITQEFDEASDSDEWEEVEGNENF